MKFRIFATLVILLIYGLLAMGSDSGDSEQRETLKRAQEKEAIGAPLNNEEKRANESYKKWEKEYDANEYNKKNYNK